MALSLHRALPLLGLGLDVLLLAAALVAGRRDPRNRAFAAFTAALAAWNLGVVGLRSADEAAAALGWEWLIHVAIALVPALFAEYVHAFLGRQRRAGVLTAAYALAAVFIVLTPTPWLLPDVRETAWGWAPVPGPAYAAFLVYFYGYLVGGAIVLGRAARRLRGPALTRARWILAGTAVALVGGAADFVRFVAGWERLYPIGIPANMVFAVALGVAIVRHRLVEVSVLVRRAVLYGVTSLALAPFLLFGVGLVAGAGRGRLAESLGGVLLVIVATATALPLLRTLERLLERVMFHREHGVRDALLRLARALNQVTDVHGLARVLTRGLVRDVPLRSAGVYVPDRSDGTFRALDRYVTLGDDVPPLPDALATALVEWLANRRHPFIAEDELLHAGDDGGAAVPVARALRAVSVALAAPIVEDDAVAAVILVGEKRSGAAFSGEELALLDAVAASAGIALRNARLYDDLRRRIEDVQAAHQQLSQSAKLAAIGELAASVAHEVNNPLMVTLAHADRLRRHIPADSPLQARLDVIEEQTQRAARILRRLLDFARRREPALAAVDVRAVLEHALELVSVRARAIGVVIQMESAGELTAVMGDRDQLTQVFVNLFNNALDAMPDGGTLRVRTELRWADGIPCAAITVSDTGVGIGAEELQQIFQPFYTTKPEGMGTGLGLSVSLGIVRRHEGTLEVTSERGKGTTFVVSLPLAPVTSQSPPRPGGPGTRG